MTGRDAILGEAALGLDLARVDFLRAGPGSGAPTRRGKRFADTVSDPRRDPSAELTPIIPGLVPVVDAVGAAHRGIAARRGGRMAAFLRPSRARDEPRAHAPQLDAAPGQTGPEARPPRSARPSLQFKGGAAPLTDRDSIFRQEALEFHAGGRDTPGGVVRLGARWIRWSYRLALVFVVTAMASLWLVRTDESASGPAVVDGRTGTVAALLPAVVGPDLASSRGITVALPGGRSVRVSIVHVQLADDTAIRNAGLAPVTQPAILVTGRLTEDTSAPPVAQDAHLPSRASVVLSSESLADVLGGQFDSILSQGTAP
jgi:hypothetical protein